MAGTVETLVVQLEGRVTQFEKAMAKATNVSSRSVDKIERDFSRANSAIAGFGKGVAGGLAGGLLAGLSLENVRRTVAEVAKLGDVAGRVGVSAGYMQQLAFAIDQAGGSAESAGPGLQKFAQNLADAKTKSGDLYKVLKLNGVSFKDAAGNLLPMEQVLGRYAELVKNAASPQEALELAVRAFGRAAGPDLVGLLSLGEEGMRSLMDQAAKMSDETVRKAQEIDDKFNALANTLGSFLKASAINAAGAFSTLSTAIGEAAIALDEWERNRRISNGEDPRALAAQQMKFLAAPTLSSDVANAFVSQVKNGQPTRVTVNKNPTKLPPSGGSSKPKRDEAAEMIAGLRFEQEQLSRTAREREIYNNLRSAGVEISSREGQQIATYTGQLYDMAAAQDAAEQSSREMQDMTEGALSGFAHDLMNGVSAAEAFSNQLKDIASQLVDMAVRNLVTNAFGGATGGGGSGIGGFLSSLFGGGRATGGPVSSNKAYLVGERGPEIMVPGRSGMVIPNHALPALGSGAVTLAPSYTIDARGADSGVEERIRNAFAQNNRQLSRDLPKMIVAARTRDHRL